MSKMTAELTSELAPYVERLKGNGLPVTEANLTRIIAEDVVIRARLGEQVAQANIMLVSDAAKRGDERAKRGLRAIERAIEEIPQQPLKVLPGYAREHIPAHQFARVVVGVEGPEAYGADIQRHLVPMGLRGIVMLANGPSLHKTGRARAIAIAFETHHETKAFCVGRKSPPNSFPDERVRRTIPPKLRSALEVGERFAAAQRIQAVRLDDSKISDFDVIVGWELGE
jgi:hypothetical protein